MIRVQLSQTARFHPALLTKPSPCSLKKSSPLIEACLRCRFATGRRSFSQKQRKAVAQKASKVPSRLVQPTSHAPRKFAEYESLNDKLATRSSPTLLYRASSYTHYIVACWTAGTFLVSIAGYNYRSQYFVVKPEDLPTFVPVSIAVGSFMIACIGFWMLLKVSTYVPWNHALAN